MTIKKLALSTVAASVLATASYAAGTLTLSGGSAETVSSELLSVQDVDANITSGLVYTNGMDASTAYEAGFELIFQDVPVTSGTLEVIDDQNVTVANYDRIEGNSIIFTTVNDKTIQRGAIYTIVSAAEANVTNTISAGDLQVTIPEDSTSATSTLKLWNNNGGQVLDTASATILSPTAQYSIAIDTPFSAEIDAANGFLTFEATHTGFNADSTTTDSYDFTFTNLKDNINHPATLSDFTMNVVADHNLSDDVQTIALAGVVMSTAEAVNDYNITFNDDGTNFDANGTFAALGTTTTDSSTAMLTSGTVDFAATTTITIDGGEVITLQNAVNAGQWTIYGYNAQIPGASYSAAAGTDTVVTVVNNSSTTASAIMTVIDEANNQCTLNSATNSAIADVASGSKNKYRLSDLVTECNNDGQTLTGTAFAIEPNVPTDPENIYANAFVENTMAANGRFKVLPVYHNKPSLNQ